MIPLGQWYIWMYWYTQNSCAFTYKSQKCRFAPIWLHAFGRRVVANLSLLSLRRTMNFFFRLFLEIFSYADMEMTSVNYMGNAWYNIVQSFKLTSWCRKFRQLVRFLFMYLIWERIIIWSPMFVSFRFIYEWWCFPYIWNKIYYWIQSSNIYPRWLKISDTLILRVTSQ